MKLNEYLDDLEEFKLDYYKDMIEENNPMRKEFKKHPINKIHNILIQEEAKLLKELVSDDDIEKYFSVYYYLLWNGYLSYNNKKFEFKNEPGEECFNLALNIITGEGCCRNIAAHFTKIINEVQNNNNFILVGTKYGINVEKIPTNEQIQEKSREEQKKALFDKFFATHMESFDNKNNIVYDPLNFNITRMNYDDISEDYFVGMYDLGWESMCGTDENMDERIKKLSQRLAKSKLLSVVKKEIKKEEDLTKLKNIGIEICTDNIKLLNEHQIKTEEGYQYIYKQLKNK